MSFNQSDPFRIRFSISNQSRQDVSAITWHLFASKNGGAYFQVTTTSDDVQSTDAGADADETAILIPRLTTP